MKINTINVFNGQTDNNMAGLVFVVLTNRIFLNKTTQQ